MKCPICFVKLLTCERQGVEIDVCPKCRGVWLDRGELEKIIERYDAYEINGHPGRDLRDHPKRKRFWQEIFK